MSAPVPSSPTQSLRALILDERPELRQRITTLLTAAGVTSYDVGSALGSTSVISRLGVDLVIVGDNLAGKNASRFVQLLRNNPHRAHLKVILLTSDPLEGRDSRDADVVLEERDLERTLVSTVRSVTRQSSEFERSDPGSCSA